MGSTRYIMSIGELTRKVYTIAEGFEPGNRQG